MTIIPDSSIGPHSRLTKRGWIPTLNQGRITTAGIRSPVYHCTGKDLVNGRGVYCLNVGGTVTEAVTTPFSMPSHQSRRLEAEWEKRLRDLATTDRTASGGRSSRRSRSPHARWRGGTITTLDVAVPRFKPSGPRTDEDTILLLRRLAGLYPDEVISGILNRQGRMTATGELLHSQSGRAACGDIAAFPASSSQHRRQMAS